MKTNLLRTGLAALLTFSAGLAMAQNQPQVIDIPLSKPGEPASLEISIVSARIEVIGEDRQDASFEVSVKALDCFDNRSENRCTCVVADS